MGTMRILLTDFTTGMVSRRTMGQLDIPYSQTAAEIIDGFVVCRDGGVRRRSGTIFVKEDLGLDPDDDGLYGTNTIPSFVVVRRGHGDESHPVLVWIDIHGAASLKAFDLRNRTEDETVDVTLRGGRALSVTHTFYSTAEDDEETQYIHLGTPDSSHRVNVHDWTVTESPSGHDLATIHQNRLVAVDREWGRVRMSVPLEMFNYDLYEDVPIPETDPPQTQTIETGAIEIVPDFYGAETVQWVCARQSLYLGTDVAEYEIKSSLPYFANEPGGATVVPISMIGTDGAEYFGLYMVFRKRERLVRMRWDQGDSYRSDNIAEMLDNDEIIVHKVIEYGSHRYLFFVDVNRHLYCMTEGSRDPALHETVSKKSVSAWSRLFTDVWWIDTYNDDLYVARDNEGAFYVEVVPLDSLSYPGTRTTHDDAAIRRNTVHADRGAYCNVTNDSLTGDALPPYATMAVYTYSEGSWISVEDESEPFVVETGESGALVTDIADIQEAVGWTEDDVEIFLHDTDGEFTSRIVTLPVHIPTELGPALGKPFTIREVVLIVHESTAAKVRINDGEWETWLSETLYSGPVPFRTDSGYDDVVQAEIRSIGTCPFVPERTAGIRTYFTGFCFKNRI